MTFSQSPTTYENVSIYNYINVQVYIIYPLNTTHAHGSVSVIYGASLLSSSSSRAQKWRCQAPDIFGWGAEAQWLALISNHSSLVWFTDQNQKGFLDQYIANPFTLALQNASPHEIPCYVISLVTAWNSTSRLKSFNCRALGSRSFMGQPAAHQAILKGFHL